jgi:hypothetical protein
MELLRYAAAFLLGLPLGLFFGRLLNAVIVNWESTRTAVRESIAAVAFLLGAGGAGAALRTFFGTDELVFYLLGLGPGMIAGYFFIKIPARYSLEHFTKIVRLSESLRPQVPDPQLRALLILWTFAPPKLIQRDTPIDQAQLARQLEQAADAVPPDNDTASAR